METQTEYAIMVEPLSVADGGGWMAIVPALPGCAGDGETREEALADVQNAISEWQAASRQLGRLDRHPRKPTPKTLAHPGECRDPDR